MWILGFDYPDDCYFYLDHDMWCRPLDGGLVEVGVNAFGIYLSSDFYMCRPKPVGTALRQGQSMAVAELSKSIVPLKTPLSGIIMEINPLLADTPEVIHRHPYGSGWLVRMQATHWAQDQSRLSHGDALAGAAGARMRLEKLPPDGGHLPAQAGAPPGP